MSRIIQIISDFVLFSLLIRFLSKQAFKNLLLIENIKLRNLLLVKALLGVYIINLFSTVILHKGKGAIFAAIAITTSRFILNLIKAIRVDIY